MNVSSGQQFMIELLVKSLVSEGVLEDAIATGIEDSSQRSPSGNALLELVEKLFLLFTEKETAHLLRVSYQ